MHAMKNIHFCICFCGAGGIRTLVQTGKQHAFYMLIPDFIFMHRQDPDHQPTPYSLKLHLNIET